MKANLLITLILFKSLLIDPTNAAGLTAKNEWGCIDNVLFNEQVMKTLLGLPEEDCLDGLPDPETLFRHINFSDSGPGDADEFESQLLETPLTFENLGMNVADIQKSKNPSDPFVDHRHNNELDSFHLSEDFDEEIRDARTSGIGQAHIQIDSGIQEKFTPLVEENLDANDDDFEYDQEMNKLNQHAIDMKEVIQPTLKQDDGLEIGQKILENTIEPQVILNLEKNDNQNIHISQSEEEISASLDESFKFSDHEVEFDNFIPDAQVFTPEDEFKIQNVDLVTEVQTRPVNLTPVDQIDNSLIDKNINESETHNIQASPKGTDIITSPINDDQTIELVVEKKNSQDIHNSDHIEDITNSVQDSFTLSDQEIELNSNIPEIKVQQPSADVKIQKVDVVINNQPNIEQLSDISVVEKDNLKISESIEKSNPASIINSFNQPVNMSSSNINEPDIHISVDKNLHENINISEGEAKISDSLDASFKFSDHEVEFDNFIPDAQVFTPEDNLNIQNVDLVTKIQTHPAIEIINSQIDKSDKEVDNILTPVLNDPVINLVIETKKEEDPNTSEHVEDIVNSVQDSMTFSDPENKLDFQIPEINKVEPSINTNIQNVDLITEIKSNTIEPSDLPAIDIVDLNIEKSLKESDPSAIKTSIHESDLFDSSLIDESNIHVSANKDLHKDIHTSEHEEQINDSLGESFKFSDHEIEFDNFIPDAQVITPEDNLNIQNVDLVTKVQDIVVPSIQKPIIEKTDLIISEKLGKSDIESIEDSIQKSATITVPAINESDILVSVVQEKKEDILISDQDEEITESLGDSINFSENPIEYKNEIPDIKVITPEDKLNIQNVDLETEIQPTVQGSTNVPLLEKTDLIISDDLSNSDPQFTKASIKEPTVISDPDIHVSVIEKKLEDIQISDQIEEINDSLGDSINFSNEPIEYKDEVPVVNVIKPEDQLNIQNVDLVTKVQPIVQKPNDVPVITKIIEESDTASIETSLQDPVVIINPDINQSDVSVIVEQKKKADIHISEQEEPINDSLDDSFHFSDASIEYNNDIPSTNVIIPEDKLNIQNVDLETEIQPRNIKPDIIIPNIEQVKIIDEPNDNIKDSEVVPPNININVIRDSQDDDIENSDNNIVPKVKESDLKISYPTILINGAPETDPVLTVTDSITESEDLNIEKSPKEIVISDPIIEDIHKTEPNIHVSILDIPFQHSVHNSEPVIEESIKKTDPIIQKTDPIIHKTEPNIHVSILDIPFEDSVHNSEPVIEESIKKTDPIIQKTDPIIHKTEPNIHVSILDIPFEDSVHNSEPIIENPIKKTDPIDNIDVTVKQSVTEKIDESSHVSKDSEIDLTDFKFSDDPIINYSNTIPELKDIKKTEVPIIHQNDIDIEVISKPAIKEDDPIKESVDEKDIEDPLIIRKPVITVDENIDQSDPIKISKNVPKINIKDIVPPSIDVNIDISKHEDIKDSIKKTDVIIPDDSDIINFSDPEIKGSFGVPEVKPNIKPEDPKISKVDIVIKPILQPSEISVSHNDHPSSIEEIIPIIPKVHKTTIEEPIIKEDIKPPSKLNVPEINPKKSELIIPEKIGDKPTIYDPKKFIFKPTDKIIQSHFTETRKKGYGKTLLAHQSIHKRVMPSIIAQTKTSVARQIFKNFPLLHKCVQSALLHCKPDFNKLKVACEDSNGRECEINDFSAKIKCAADEDLISNTCYKKCPEGFKDYKLFCLKPPYVKRSFKEFDNQDLADNEEFYGDNLVVEKCSKYGKYMFDFGPNYCRAKCPIDFRDRGLFCQKPARFQKQQVHVFERKTAIRSE